MAKTTRNTTKQQVRAFLEANKYNEDVSYATKSEIKFEHEVGDQVKYVGGTYFKDATCTIIRRAPSKGKIYYDVIFDNMGMEVKYIMEGVLKKIEVEAPIENIENEIINPDIIESEENHET